MYLKFAVRKTFNLLESFSCVGCERNLENFSSFSSIVFSRKSFFTVEQKSGI